MEDFSSFIAAEVERLTLKRNAAIEAVRAAEAEVKAVDTEFQAIAAYQAAKAGRLVVPGTGASAGRRRSSGGRRGARREEICRLVASNPQGLKRSEILDQLGLKGDKGGEMSVSNALTALVKNNELARGERGVYTAAVAA